MLNIMGLHAELKKHGKKVFNDMNKKLYEDF